MSESRWLLLGVILVGATVTTLGAQQPVPGTPPQSLPAAPSAVVCRISGRASGAGATLPGVSITATAAERVQGATATGVDGRYRFSLPPGTYALSAELTGFAPIERTLTVAAAASGGCEQTLDVAMTLAPATPMAPAVAVQTSPGAPLPGAPGGRGRAAGPGPGATGQRFQALDLRAGRAGVEGTQADGDNAELLMPAGFGNEASADAIAITGNTARVDRSQLNDRFDALGRGDFILGENGPPMQFNGGGGGDFGGGRGGGGGGRGGGGGGFGLGGRGGRQSRVNVQANYSFSGSALESAPYQLRGGTAARTPYARQSFNTTIGGPLKIPHVYDGSNTSTYNFSYNGGRGSNLFDQYGTVPTAAMRGGDLSNVSTQLYDPLTGAAFAGNQVPVSRYSRQALALLPFIPLPNLEGDARNFHYTTTTASQNDSFSLRLTHNFTPNAAGAGGRGGAGGPGGGGRGGFGGGQAGGGGRGAAQQRRGTVVNLNTQIQYSRNSGTQTNIFQALGGTTHSTSLTLPVGLNVIRGRMIHNLNVNFSRSTSSTKNHFGGVRDVAGAAGIGGVSTDPFSWGVPTLSFTSLTGLRDASPSLRSDQRTSLSYTLVRPTGKHQIRAGGDYRWDRSNSRTEANANGNFLFTGLYTSNQCVYTQSCDPTAAAAPRSDFADFLLGAPQSASLQYGPGHVILTGRSASLYVQDDWRARSNLTMNLGLRYELTWPFVEKNGHLVNLDVAQGFTAAAPVVASGTGAFTGKFPAGLVTTDTNNLAPRIGAAWRVRPGTVLNSGYSIQYNNAAYANFARQFGAQPPFATTDTKSGKANALLLMENALSGRSADVTTNNFGVDKDYALGRVQTANATLSQTFWQVWQASAGYTYTRGASLDIVRAPNRGPDGLLIADVQPFLWQTSEGSSRLHSGNFRLEHRQTRGIGWNVTYTVARSRDNAPSIGGGGSAGAVAQNEQDLDAEWGLSNFDQRQRLSAGSQIELPFGPNRRWLNNGGRWAPLLESWRLSLTFSADAGRPFTPRVQGASRDVSQGTSGALRANYDGSAVALSDPTIDRFFNTSAFTIPTGAYGTSPRNIIIGPGSRQLDGQLSRDVRLGGNRSMSIRIQANNLLNLVNYQSIDTSVTSPTFGQVLSVRSMRSATLNLGFRF